MSPASQLQPESEAVSDEANDDEGDPFSSAPSNKAKKEEDEEGFVERELASEESPEATGSSLKAVEGQKGSNSLMQIPNYEEEEPSVASVSLASEGHVARVRQILESNDPARLENGDLEKLLNKYKGQEEKLIEGLQRKYNIAGLVAQTSAESTESLDQEVEQSARFIDSGSVANMKEKLQRYTQRMINDCYVY